MEHGLDVLCRLGLNLKLCTGIKDVDKALDDGISAGDLVEFVGEFSCGKTQILYSLTASFLLSSSKAIIWIDFNGSFKATRLAQCLGSVDDPMPYLDRVFISKVHDVTTLQSVLQGIEGLAPEALEKIGLLCVDNIGSIMARTSWVKEERLRQNVIASFFRKLSKSGFTILTTNHFAYSENERKPALGRNWRNLNVKRYSVAVDTFGPYVARYLLEDNKELETLAGRFGIGENGIKAFDYID